MTAGFELSMRQLQSYTAEFGQSMVPSGGHKLEDGDPAGEVVQMRPRSGSAPSRRVVPNRAVVETHEKF